MPRRSTASDVFSVPILLHTIGLSGLLALPFLFVLLATASRVRLEGGGSPTTDPADQLSQPAFSIHFVSGGLILVLGAVRLARGTSTAVDGIRAGVALLIVLLAAGGWAVADRQPSVSTDGIDPMRPSPAATDRLSA
ncbi:MULTISPECIES: hypothetical protein [unclassified Rathayibacter]|uniref:hypothetical protein n=1 Tax=unclassified Rathayibacter TaxID=2609250 RepID=UPI000F4B454F|nr:MULTISPECIES: hypothetical protein [unclassified Rathayibacter]ROP50197.1 hypothetical protein EDF45_1606 [Rathayibacter sp. PhB186]ROS53155.1 hypothetical protein EDF44_1606 [Rathayibacter sp. PhB185]